jgi:hypothetical protein
MKITATMSARVSKLSLFLSTHSNYLAKKERNKTKESKLENPEIYVDDQIDDSYSLYQITRDRKKKKAIKR